MYNISYPQSTFEPTGWHSGGKSVLWLVCLATRSHSPELVIKVRMTRRIVKRLGLGMGMER